MTSGNCSPLNEIGIFEESTGAALFGYLEDAHAADNALGQTMRLLSRTLATRPDRDLATQASLQDERSDPWLATSLRAVVAIAQSRTGAHQMAIDAVSAHFWSTNRGGGYPLFGLLRYLAGCPNPFAVPALLEPFQRLAPKDAGIRSRLVARGNFASWGNLIGLMVAGAKRSSTEQATRNVLTLVERFAGREAAIRIARDVLDADWGGTRKSIAALKYLGQTEGLPNLLRSLKQRQARDRPLGTWGRSWFASALLSSGMTASATAELEALQETGARDIAENATASLLSIRLQGLLDLIGVSKGKEQRQHLLDLAVLLQDRLSQASSPVLAEAFVTSIRMAFDLDALDVFERVVKVLATPAGRGLRQVLAASLETAAQAYLQAHPVPNPLSPSYAGSSPLSRFALALYHRGQLTKAFMCWASIDRQQMSEDEALNFGFAALAVQRPATANQAFQGITRVYIEALRNVVWPASREQIRWPYKAFDLAAAFSALLPPGVAWPKISIVIPSFNQVKYVEETLLSLKGQDYPNLQLIICDSLSTDGTQDIIRRYQDIFDVVLIEKDKGQSDAINKGMQLATGDILHWLNTDDMLAPGACFAVAIKYLQTGADVIAGSCVEFDQGRLLILNRPSATSEEFVVDELCKQFDRWLRGHFFYQPEVFFSRAIWEKAGGHVRTDSNFAMDFDLWVRFANAGGVYNTIDWPIALFRKHPEQKTFALSDTIDEQAAMVRLHTPDGSETARNARLRNRLAVLRDREPRIAVVSKRFDKIFSGLTEDELRAEFDGVASISMSSRPGDVDVRGLDLIIHLCHVQGDYADIQDYRDRGYRGAVAGWFWDNHHEYFENRRTAEQLDLIVAGHDFCKEYLRNGHAVLGESVPLCITQWTGREAAKHFEQLGLGTRLDDLYGGFVRYDAAPARNKLVTELAVAGYSDVVHLMPENSIKRYFGMSRAERFAEWSSYKVSLCLPVRKDLSQRFYDAWLTGQIPIVSSDVLDLHPLLSQEELASHVVFFDKYTVESVAAAHRKALALFDERGLEGAMRRHQMATSGHLFHHRVRTIFDAMRALKAKMSPGQSIVWPSSI